MQSSRKSRPLSEDAIERALEQFRSIVRGRSLRASQVREQVARAALAQPGHFSVDDLCYELDDKGAKDAHMATIYRAIPLLIEAGLIQPALMSQGEGQRYEVIFEKDHHDHLVCTGCGRIVEFRSEALEALQRDIADRYEFLLDDHVLELLGRCKNCRATAPKPRGIH
ncbi:MAG TPA: Fur family transcriptional regulator [Polyangiaceae bacterium]|nr:Fur family transcriptional regulator [Polyangiaceae bacterium]